MIKSNFLFFILIFIDNSSVYADFSLFFNHQELSSTHTQVCEKQEKISLSGIIYTDENHWTLWVNGKIVHPETAHMLDGFSIEKVTADEVTFSIIASEGEERTTITLRPQLSYTPIRKRDVILR